MVFLKDLFVVFFQKSWKITQYADLRVIHMKYLRNLWIVLGLAPRL